MSALAQEESEDMYGALVTLSLKKSVAREEAVKGAALSEYMKRMELERQALEDLELITVEQWKKHQSK